jgi:antitoxin PrlF
MKNIKPLQTLTKYERALKEIETYFKNVPARSDLTIAAFLSFLSRDVGTHPEMLRAFPAGLAKRIATLTEGVEFDPNAKSEDAVAL